MSSHQMSAMSSGNRRSNVIDCSTVIQSGKPINSKFPSPYNNDIAPVHCSSSKIMTSQNKNLGQHCTENHRGGNLSTLFNEKLDLNSKNCEVNGTNIITTDAEIHWGPGDILNHVQETNSKSLCNELKHRAVNNSECAIVSQEGHRYGPPSSQTYNISNNSSSSCKLQNEINCIVKCKEKITYVNDGICNGYSVSEATSSNSISVSDMSAVSDKSIDSSASSSLTSKRLMSNNSYSQQQYDNNSSFGSDSYKVPDISFSPVSTSIDPSGNDISEISYANYLNENQMSSIMKLIQKDLSEPYSIYTYRYFIHNWPKLCFLAIHKTDVVGAIVCKLDMHKKTTVRGYIAMLAVDEKYRKKKIGSNLVLRAIRAMSNDDADEVVLETEITNQPALKLYENLGFVRDKRLFRYYLNGVDALRLKLWLR